MMQTIGLQPQKAMKKEDPQLLIDAIIRRDGEERKRHMEKKGE